MGPPGVGKTSLGQTIARALGHKFERMGLSGLILPVGGVKEKVLAAHRAGLQRVVLPKENENDLAELPPHVREDLEFVFAERIEDLLAAVIPGLADRLCAEMAVAA